MSLGRGSASQAMVVVAVLLCLLVHFEHVHAATYTVGDSGGWTFNTDSWPKGKRFRAGDVLPVDRAGYSSCTSPAGAKVYNSGKDQIKLAKGQNYFICNFSGHCASGMKVAINAV
ncbi:basic blue protein-like isoform X1 [Quercus lobata]|uniref:basic blue protein-like isoform X1 n=1 Tax=Quercus lobata TaxID=97700 RepID=UPI00124763C4|nr:basic blue protein-like isoform X1 [Quercus lobata]